MSEDTVVYGESQAFCDAAIAYARLGFHVFPLVPNGKTPLISGGFKAATTNTGQISAWWAATPRANIGIATGESGLVVIDLDVKGGRNGVEAWQDLYAKYGFDVSTWLVETPTGGIHCYFRGNGHDIASSAGKLGKGIDVRATGGYVVAPPSIVNGKRYYWLQDLSPETLVNLPDALASLLRDGSNGNGTMQKQPVDVDSDVPEGERNYTLARYVGKKLAEGVPPAQVYEMAVLFNNARCKPPLPVKEVNTIVRSIVKKDMAGKVATAQATDGVKLPRIYETCADILAKSWCGKYIYDKALACWRKYNGVVWVKIDEGELISAASETIRRDVCGLDIDEKYQEKLADCTTTPRGVQFALLYLRGRPGMAADINDFDKDPYLFNCRNVTINLRTLTAQPHNPEDLCTYVADVDFDASAKCPKWLKHLEYFLPSENVRRQLRRDIGKAMVGEQLEEILTIWQGVGANGKSTTSNVLRRIFGDYATVVDPKMLVLQKYDGHPTELTVMNGKRMLFASEIPANAKLDEARVKSITGGEEILARYLYHEPFVMRPTWSIFLSCNMKPTITGVDNGIWRRIRIILWDKKIDPSIQREQAEVVKDLLSEASGILNWLLQGWADAKANKKWVAEEVLVETQEYRERQDIVGDFLSSRCVIGDEFMVKVSTLYDTYCRWCENEKETPVGKHTFNRKMDSKGFKQERVGHYRDRYWIGIGLK